MEPLLSNEAEVAPANPFLETAPALTFQEHYLPAVSTQPVPQRVPSEASLQQGSSFTPEPHMFPPPPLIPYSQPGAVYSSAAPTPKQAPGSGGYFSATRWQPYFNVDTADVFARIRLACIPVGSSFWRAVLDNPDLYGPFWICATLVFVSAATGNASAYMAFRQLEANSGTSLSFYPDITKVSVSAAVFFSYVAFLPLAVWGTLKYWGVPSSLTGIITLYGYSLFIFIPVSVLSIIPFDAVRWPINMVGAAISITCLVFNLRAVTAELPDAKKRSILLGVAGACQLGLAVAMKLYMFSYRSA